MDSVRTLVDADAFRVALAVGLGAGVLVALLRRPAAGFVRPVLGTAVPLAVAAAAGLSVDDRLPHTLVAALVALGLAGGLLQVGGPRRLPLAIPGVVLLGAGALLLVAAEPEVVARWVEVAVLVVTLAGVPLAVRFAARLPRLSPLLLAMSAAGVYWTVPDTEQAIPVLGAFAAVALLGLDPASPADGAGASVSVGLLAWVAGAGGYGRPGAVVGAAACLGVVLLAPLVGAVPRRLEWREVGLLLGLQAVVVLACSRVAGLRDSRTAAAAIVGVVYAVAALALRTARRR